MRLKLNVEYVTDLAGAPSKRMFVKWAHASLKGMRRASVTLGLRVVDKAESAALNKRYRRKNGPTNVLSFSFEYPPGVRTDILGDVVVCASIVKREAAVLERPERAHWAHMLVHGIMHLRGYDHENQKEAAIMEAKEAGILRGLGFRDPYA